MKSRRAALFVVAACAAAYLPALLAVALGAWPFDGDAVAQFGPWRLFARNTMWHGTVPLWNPHIFCGMPFMANGQSAVLYPPNMVYWLLPELLAVFLDAFGHSVLLAVGMYLLARALGLGRPAAVIAAVAMALGTDVSAHLYAGHMPGHAGRAYTGWNLWALLMLLRTGRLRYAVASALLLVLQFAAGYPPVTLMSYELCAAMVGAWLLTRLVRREAALPPRWPRSMAVLLAVAVTVGGVYVLPMREASKMSVHGDGLRYAEAVQTSGTWKTFARAFAPDLFGGDSEWQWSQPINSHEEAGYIGIIALVLALGSPWWARRGAAPRYPIPMLWLWGLLLGSALLVLGENTPLYRFLFDHLAVMRLTRIPARWMEAWSIAAALLAAFSFESMRLRLETAQDAAPVRGLVRALGAFVAAGVLIVVLALVVTPHASLWMTTAQHYLAPASAAVRLARATRLRMKAILAALIMTVLAGLGASFASKWRTAPDGAQRLRRERMLIGLIALDVILFCWSGHQAVAPQTMAGKIRWADVFRADYTPGARWVTHFDDERAVSQGMPAGIDIFNGYDPLAGRRFFATANYLEGAEFWSALYQPTHYSSLMRVAAVSHSIEDAARPQPRPGVAATVERRSGMWQLTRLPAPWPREYLTDDVREVPDGVGQLSALEKLGGFASDAPPVVAAPGTFAAVPSSHAERGQVRVSSRALNTVTMDVNCSAPQVLVQADALYPGWQAWCNGRQVPLRSANYLFRGMEVPAGRSQVTLVYNANSYRFGLFLTLCGMAGVLAMVLALRNAR